MLTYLVWFDIISKSRETGDRKSNICGSVGTGRRARLRILWLLQSCGFKSHLPHSVIKWKPWFFKAFVFLSVYSSGLQLGYNFYLLIDRFFITSDHRRMFHTFSCRVVLLFLLLPIFQFFHTIFRRGVGSSHPFLVPTAHFLPFQRLFSAGRGQ